MENEKLIEALRNNYSPDLHVIEDMQKAADALERLAAQNVAKDAEIKRLKEQVQYNHDCYFSEFAEKNRLQAELDAAKRVICRRCRSIIPGTESTGGRNCAKCEWRGKEHD